MTTMRGAAAARAAGVSRPSAESAIAPAPALLIRPRRVVRDVSAATEATASSRTCAIGVRICLPFPTTVGPSRIGWTDASGRLRREEARRAGRHDERALREAPGGSVAL